MEISGSIKGAVAIVVITVVLLAMTPTVIDQVQNLQTGNVAITGETLGSANNVTTIFYFDETPCQSGSETIYQNTTDMDGLFSYTYGTGIYIIGVEFDSAPNSLYGDISADYTDEGWTFTGYEGGIALLGLIPFLWVAGILAGASLGMFTLYKSNKGK